MSFRDAAKNNQRRCMSPLRQPSDRTPGVTRRRNARRQDRPHQRVEEARLSLSDAVLEQSRRNSRYLECGVAEQ